VEIGKNLNFKLTR